MEDEYFESLTPKQKRLVLGALEEDPTAEIDEVPTIEVPQTDLHAKSKELLASDWQVIPHRLREAGIEPNND